MDDTPDQEDVLDCCAENEKVVNDGKKYTFRREDETLGALLQYKLVTERGLFAAYNKKSPLINEIDVIVGSNNHEKELEYAVYSLIKDCSNFEKVFSEGMKKKNEEEVHGFLQGKEVAQNNF